MDKETLSNYGWIVICVLVLAVMLALATPFGTFIADGFKATYTGLFQTGDNALDVGLSAVGVSNKLPCGHGRKEAGDHSQKECGHYNCQDADCGCVPASCGVEGHWSGDGMDHDTTVYGHRTHSRKCQCTPGWTVPDGGTYTLRTAVDGKTVFNGGETLPDCYVVSFGDKFLYGDYEYGYHQIYNDNNGWPGWTNYECNWSVHAVDKTKTSYGPILTSINGQVVDSLYETFFGCTNLTSEGIPEIPNSIKIMSGTFWGCTSIVTAPTIPNSITNMFALFWKCTSLTGTVTINANPTSHSYCFRDVNFNTQNLTLAGDSTMLDTFGATGTNYCAECNGCCKGGH